MRRRNVPALLLFAAWVFISEVSGQHLVPGRVDPPAPRREFRGAWVASVKNIDWPSRRGLSTAQQQAELRSILDHAKGLGMNAIILQVRPACDALYQSRYEPWSEYLTGQMGRAPSPFYDPLAFAVEEAHARGLELHAWFNPYRARHNENGGAAKNHITRTRPDLIVKYGVYQWLDPARKEARDLALSVILDVVRRYDIDGVHVDDYFYPYQVKDSRGRKIDFPDVASWTAYRRSGAKLSRLEWRRQHVDEFVSLLYRHVKGTKPWVKVGISPFGIWRPGVPAGIEAGIDSYNELAADARKWLNKGWLDYCSPQLYWPNEPRAQSYSALLHWWAGENNQRRHLWPGIATDRIGSDRKAHEIARQIEFARRERGVTGHVHWNMKAVKSNRGGVGKLLQGSYAVPALVPGSPWLGGSKLRPPRLGSRVGRDGKTVVKWETGDKDVRFWVLQWKSAGDARWRTDVVSSSRRALTLPGPVDAVAVAAYSRTGYLSEPSGLVRR